MLKIRLQYCYVHISVLTLQYTRAKSGQKCLDTIQIQKFQYFSAYGRFQFEKLNLSYCEITFRLRHGTLERGVHALRHHEVKLSSQNCPRNEQHNNRPSAVMQIQSPLANISAHDIAISTLWRDGVGHLLRAGSRCLTPVLLSGSAVEPSKAGVRSWSSVCGADTSMANQLVHFRVRDDQCRRSLKEVNCYKQRFMIL
ncbi:Hypothetical_protein [Hexamita inflata]|uniref:Hypothetical_protein n=1 Tax=Hexamita inflata TaxID=28002 RepID=A0AA86RSJ6_9EUKA|nr:Hypothetical protein HINF_LOCUS59425 [Hexamita inflata]